MHNNGSVIVVTMWKVYSAIWLIIELVFFLFNIKNTTQYVAMEEKCSND